MLLTDKGECHVDEEAVKALIGGPGCFYAWLITTISNTMHYVQLYDMWLKRTRSAHMH